MRSLKSVHISNPETFKNQLLLWSQKFEEIVWLDSNNYKQKYANYDAVLAVEAFTSIQTDYYDAFEQLKIYQSSTKDWLFGYLSYDLKNDVEALTSKNFDGLHFPELCFFQPKKLFFLKGNILEMHYLNFVADEAEDDLRAIESVVTSSDICKSDICIYSNKMIAVFIIYFIRIENTNI